MISANVGVRGEGCGVAGQIIRRNLAPKITRKPYSKIYIHRTVDETNTDNLSI